MGLVIVTSIIGLVMMLALAVLRMKVSEQATSKKRIILPPLFMSTGALMFIFPYFRLSKLQVLESLSLGVFFSLFLIFTSKLEVKNKEIYLKPSKAFIFILFALIIVRTLAKLVIGSKIALGETAGVFFLLGFGMIFTWRIVMLIKYTRLKREIKKMH